MKIICTACGRTMSDMPWLAQVAHVTGDQHPKDEAGHHIAIQAKREWCPGPWEEYISEKCLGGLPWGGGSVIGSEVTLADGRVLIRDYFSLREPNVTVRWLGDFHD